MTAGRKPNREPEVHADVLDPIKTQAAGQALNVVSQRSKEVAERYGDGLPYDRGRMVSQVRFYLSQSAEAMLEAGKGLLQLKENEPHGDFIDIVENRLGMSRRTAQVMMQASVKYLAPALASKAQAPALLSLGKSKLLELMAEPDDDIEALADGGTLAGLDLDDITAMSSRELRDALRESKKKLATRDRQLADKNKKIDELDAALHPAGSDKSAEAQITELRETTLAARDALLRMLGVADFVLSTPHSETAEQCARHSVEFLVQSMVDACTARNIAVDLAERVSPIWQQQIEATATRSRRK